MRTSFLLWLQTWAAQVQTVSLGFDLFKSHEQNKTFSLTCESEMETKLSALVFFLRAHNMYFTYKKKNIFFILHCYHYWKETEAPSPHVKWREALCGCFASVVIVLQSSPLLLRLWLWAAFISHLFFFPRCRMPTWTRAHARAHTGSRAHTHIQGLSEQCLK